MGIKHPSPAYKSKAKNITLLNPQTTPRHQDQAPQKSITTQQSPASPDIVPPEKGERRQGRAAHKAAEPTGAPGSSFPPGTFFRFWPRKCSSASLCTDVSSAWNQLQMRCACSHVEWCSKNLYSASWYFTHSLLPAGRDWCHTEADTPAMVTLTLGPRLLGCFAFVPLLQRDVWVPLPTTTLSRIHAPLKNTAADTH